MFAVCLDIGGACAGVMVGAMNAASQFGSLVSSLVLDIWWIAMATYNFPFIPMAALLFTGAWLWLKVDPTEQLIREAQAVAVDVA
jgi:hypothetical protein